MSNFLNYSIQNWNKVSTSFLNYLLIQHLHWKETHFTVHLVTVIDKLSNKYSQDVFEGCLCKAWYFAIIFKVTKSKMKLLTTILKLKIFSCKLLLQIASSLLLLEVLDQLLVKYDFLNILGYCFSQIKNYLLCKIIARMCSGSLPLHDMELSVATVNIWKLLTCVWKTAI